jgi:copper transport protein
MIKFARRATVLSLAMTLAMPVLLWAHARLTRSDPAANARLEVAPTAIRLWFSEAPEVPLSSITLKDSTGAVVRLAAIRRGDTTASIEAPILDPLEGGRYVVWWRVAGSDGHPITGSFSFVSAGTVVPLDTTPAQTHPDASDPLSGNAAESAAYVAARAVGFGGLLVVIGAVVFYYLVLGRFILADIDRTTISRRLASTGAVAAVVALVSAAARLVLQWQMLNVDPAAARIHLSVMTMETQWGTAWVIQAVALLVVLGAFSLARGEARSAWAVAGVASIVMAASPALGGHAAANADSYFVSVFADTLHVLGASAWLGSLFCLLVVAVPVLATRADDGWQSIASLVNIFSPVALGAASLVLVTGLVTAWMRLGAVGPLWTTGYGRTLLIKIALLIGVAGVGAYNWQRVRPALGTASATARLRNSAFTELALGVVVIVVTAVLVALPTPVVSSR